MVKSLAETRTLRHSSAILGPFCARAQIWRGAESQDYDALHHFAKEEENREDGTNKS